MDRTFWVFGGMIVLVVIVSNLSSIWGVVKSWWETWRANDAEHCW